MKTYDPKQILITLGGIGITGYAEDTFVTVRRNADAWALTMGVDGEGTRSKSNDKSGQIELTLMQSSRSNEYLSNLALADENNNAGIVPFLMRDNLGSSLYAAEQTYVKKLAEAPHGRTAQGRTWIIETDNLQAFIGGN